MEQSSIPTERQVSTSVEGGGQPATEHGPVETPLARASRELSDIWKDFYRHGGDKNPNAGTERRKKVAELNDRTDPTVMEVFEHSVTSADNNVPSQITYGMQIRNKAQEVVAKEFAESEKMKREAVKINPPKKSAGARLHDRRVKAQQRRGTNPQDVH